MASRFQRFMDSNGEWLPEGTLAEMADTLEVDPSTVSKKVSGDRPWKTSEANVVLEFLSKKLGRRVLYDEIFAPEPARVGRGK